MKVLVVGGGGREHAIVRKLKESRGVTKLYCAPGNGGIAMDAECVNIAATDIDAMVRFAEKEQIDYVVVAPDDPISHGHGRRTERGGNSRLWPQQGRRAH